MQQVILGFKSAFCRKISALKILVLITVLLNVLTFTVFVAPSNAAAELTPTEKIDRAYEISESAGLEEEIYQQRLGEGQNPEEMPKPFRRVLDANEEPIPETSLLEKSIDKARELVDRVGDR